MGQGKGNGLQRDDSKRNLCGDGTVPYLECSSGYTDLHMRYHTEIQAHANEYI